MIKDISKLYYVTLGAGILGIAGSAYFENQREYYISNRIDRMEEVRGLENADQNSKFSLFVGTGLMALCMGFQALRKKE